MAWNKFLDFSHLAAVTQFSFFLHTFLTKNNKYGLPASNQFEVVTDLSYFFAYAYIDHHLIHLVLAPHITTYWPLIKHLIVWVISTRSELVWRFFLVFSPLPPVLRRPPSVMALIHQQQGLYWPHLGLHRKPRISSSFLFSTQLKSLRTSCDQKWWRRWRWLRRWWCWRRRWWERQSPYSGSAPPVMKQWAPAGSREHLTAPASEISAHHDDHDDDHLHRCHCHHHYLYHEYLTAHTSEISAHYYEDDCHRGHHYIYSRHPNHEIEHMSTSQYQLLK